MDVFFFLQVLSMWDVAECLKIGLLAVRAIGKIMSIMQNKKEREVFVSVDSQSIYALYLLCMAGYKFVY